MEMVMIVRHLTTRSVLILIIMEDTHGDKIVGVTANRRYCVLILIIMEDTHGALGYTCRPNNELVLILIIMEDTHGACRLYTIRHGLIKS